MGSRAGCSPPDGFSPEQRGCDGLTWLWLDIQIYKFSLAATLCRLQIGIIFPSQEHPSPLQMSKIRPWLGLDSIRMGAQDRRSSTLDCWPPALALCLPLSLFLTKFMLLQLMSFLLWSYPPSTPRYWSKDNPLNGFTFSYREWCPPPFS